MSNGISSNFNTDHPFSSVLRNQSSVLNARPIHALNGDVNGFQKCVFASRVFIILGVVANRRLKIFADVIR